MMHNFLCFSVGLYILIIVKTVAVIIFSSASNVSRTSGSLSYLTVMIRSVVLLDYITILAKFVSTRAL